MRPLTAACIIVLVLFARPGGAQSKEINFSGRWVLAASGAASPLEPDTLEISAADEILIIQTKLSITVDHPSKRAAYPAAGTFEFGSGGFVGGLPNSGVNPTQGRWGTTFFGTQLMMSKSTTTADNGVDTTVAYGSFWSLDERGRLVIEFREEHSRERPKTAVRIYTRKR